MAFLKASAALALLARHKLPIAKSVVAKSALAAQKAAHSIGCPVAMKLCSEDIVHKSDLGLVKLAVAEKDVQSTFQYLVSTARKKAPKAKIEGVLVMQMLVGQEIIMGMKQDEQFGPVIMFGLGGIFVEVLKEVSFALAPLTSADALGLLVQNKGFAALNARGRKFDAQYLIDLLLKLSKLAAENKRIMEIEFNPVIVSEKAAIIADFRVRMR